MVEFQAGATNLWAKLEGLFPGLDVAQLDTNVGLGAIEEGEATVSKHTPTEVVTEDPPTTPAVVILALRALQPQGR